MLNLLFYDIRRIDNPILVWRRTKFLFGQFFTWHSLSISQLFPASTSTLGSYYVPRPFKRNTCDLLNACHITSVQHMTMMARCAMIEISLIYYHLLNDIVAALCKYSSYFMIQIVCNELLAVNRRDIFCTFFSSAICFFFLLRTENI